MALTQSGVPFTKISPPTRASFPNLMPKHHVDKLVATLHGQAVGIPVPIQRNQT